MAGRGAADCASWHALRGPFRRAGAMRQGDPARDQGGRRGHPMSHGRRLRVHARRGHDVRHENVGPGSEASSRRQAGPFHMSPWQESIWPRLSHVSRSHVRNEAVDGHPVRQVSEEKRATEPSVPHVPDVRREVTFVDSSTSLRSGTCEPFCPSTCFLHERWSTWP